MLENTKTNVQAHDAGKAEEKRRHPEPAQGGLNAIAGDALILEELLGSSAVEPHFERHAALLGDPRFSHSANARQKAQMVTDLQSRYGNACVQRLVESRTVQTKLTVNPPDDQYEREADVVGERLAKTTSVEREAKPEGGIDAGALTSGEDVFCRNGDYQPGSDEGNRLLGEEITSVAQQNGGRLSRDAVETQPRKASEANAATKSDAVAGIRDAVETLRTTFERANIARVLLWSRICDKFGAETAAKNAMDEAADLALAALKTKFEAFDIESPKADMVAALLRASKDVYNLGRDEEAAEAALRKAALGAENRLKTAITRLHRSRQQEDVTEVFHALSVVQVLSADPAIEQAAYQELKLWHEIQLADAVKKLRKERTEANVKEVLKWTGPVHYLGGDTARAYQEIDYYRQRTAQVAAPCPAVQRQNEDASILTSTTACHVPEVTGGQALPDNVRSSVEPALGHALSDVRLHTDAEADRLARQLKAKAFTTGRDVFFREGDYEPDTQEGRGLIGHELTHMVQQGVARVMRGQAPSEEKTAAQNKKRYGLSALGSNYGSALSLEEVRQALRTECRGGRFLIESGLGVIADIEKIRKEQPYVSEVVSTMAGGADDLLHFIFDDWRAALSRIERAEMLTERIGEHPQFIDEVVRQLLWARRLYEIARDGLKKYAERRETGCERAITGLTVVKDVSFAVAGAAAAPALLPAGAGFIATGAVTIAASGTLKAVEEVATQSSEIWVGLRGKFDYGQAVRNTGTAALTALAGHLVGGVIGKVFFPRFFQGVSPGLLKTLSEEMGEEITAETFETLGQKLFREWLEGVGKAVATQAIQAAVEKAKPGEKWTPEEFAERVAREFSVGDVSDRVARFFVSALAPTGNK